MPEQADAVITTQATIAEETTTTSTGAEEQTLAGGSKETTEDGGTETQDASNVEKKEEKSPDSKVVPEKYEFKLPEGVTMDEKTMELFTPIFKELGITSEGAQKLVDAYIPLIQSSIEKTREEALKQYDEITNGWKKETMEKLGTDANKKLAFVARAINKFGSEAFRTFLDNTKVGNNIEVVNLLMKVGETLSEDTLTDLKGETVATGGDILKRMYPSMKQ